MAKRSIKKEDDFFFRSKFGLKLRRKLVKFYIWKTTMYGAETWKPRKGDQQHKERYEMG
jgi:hypothetical protein